MPLQPSRTTSIMGIVLVGAWSGLALGLGVLLSQPTENARPLWVASEERRSSNISIDVAGVDPCTDEPVKVLARLTIDIAGRGEPGSAGLDVDVYLETLPGTALIETQPGAVLTGAIEPFVRRFVPYSIPSAGIPNLHPLRTPLAGRHSSLDLAVDLVGTVDESGAVSLSMLRPRIDGQRSPCSTSTASSPGQPVTLGVRSLPPV